MKSEADKVAIVAAIPAHIDGGFTSDDEMQVQHDDDAAMDIGAIPKPQRQKRRALHDSTVPGTSPPPQQTIRPSTSATTRIPDAATSSDLVAMMQELMQQTWRHHHTADTKWDRTGGRLAKNQRRVAHLGHRVKHDETAVEQRGVGTHRRFSKQDRDLQKKLGEHDGLHRQRAQQMSNRLTEIVQAEHEVKQQLMQHQKQALEAEASRMRKIQSLEQRIHQASGRAERACNARLAGTTTSGPAGGSGGDETMLVVGGFKRDTLAGDVENLTWRYMMLHIAFG